MNERDLPRLIGGAAVSTRKRKLASELMHRSNGPSFKETLETAPVLLDTFAICVSAPDLPKLSYEEYTGLAHAEDKAQRAWENKLADRVRAGELAIETAISAAAHYSYRLAHHQARRTW
jgi:hypothetical protein